MKLRKLPLYASKIFANSLSLICSKKLRNRIKHIIKLSQACSYPRMGDGFMLPSLQTNVLESSRIGGGAKARMILFADDL
uniref:hypothetical protein n=1 Tax=Helicobacter typhlonius TaxID=76936 RepID=UPI002FDF6B7D